jgi:glycosyltransferase involved in cell wall biosynthesis
MYNVKNDITNTMTLLKGLRSPDFEFVFIDGASNDGTVDLINSNEFSPDVFISEPDNGIYDAMNKGAANASGEWLYFFNVGDGLGTDFSEIVRRLKTVTAKKNIVYGDSLVLSQNNPYVKAAKISGLASFYLSMPVCHQSVFYRHSHFQSYDLNYRVIADKVSLYKTYKVTNGDGFLYVPLVVSEYAVGGFSQMNINLMCREEARFIHQVVGIPSLLSFFVFYYRFARIKASLFLKKYL